MMKMNLAVILMLVSTATSMSQDKSSIPKLNPTVEVPKTNDHKPKVIESSSSGVINNTDQVKYEVRDGVKSKVSVTTNAIKEAMAMARRINELISADEVEEEVKDEVKSQATAKTNAITEAVTMAKRITELKAMVKELALNTSANFGHSGLPETLWTIASEIKDKVSSKNFTSAVAESFRALGKEVKSYLKGTDIEKLKEDARSFVSLSVPQSGFFSNLVGLDTGSISNLVFYFFIGWPIFLALLYVGLIVLFPNRRSDNYFEKNLSTMVDTMSYAMHAAEDSFLDFMEDITEPDDPYATAGSNFHPAYAFPNPLRRQEVYYKPTAFYDEYGQHFDTEYDFDYGDHEGDATEGQLFDAWGNPIDSSSSFVNPQGSVHNPVSSFSLESSEPLREQIQGGDVSSLVGGNFDLQNEIAQKDKHNFINVVLGTQYQHSKPLRSGSLEDPAVVQGTVGTDISGHPEPPRRYRPSQSSSSSSSSSKTHSSFFGNERFQADVDPRLKNHTEGDPSGFRPSRLINSAAVENDWVARPRPFRRNGRPVGGSETPEEGSTFRFPSGEGTE